MPCGAQLCRTPSPSLGIKHVKHGLTGCREALNCAVLLLPAWGQTKTARQRGNVLAQAVKLSRVDLAIIVNISVTKAHGKHAVELTASVHHARQEAMLNKPGADDHWQGKKPSPGGAASHHRARHDKLREKRSRGQILSKLE